MELFKKNIINVFGEAGKIWLTKLPAIISSLAECWGLKQITPVNNMTFNYVATAVTRLDQPVVLKISCDAK